ncbi:hypothetical protein R4K92_03870 [Brachyspira intermedia]|uniref:hypothetical protein n=1 Tax=Brachyspira intermedia TaxID=84377 RepID=UPI003004A7D7
MLTFGSLSEEGRSNGIQGDAIQNIYGELSNIICAWGVVKNGVLEIIGENPTWPLQAGTPNMGSAQARTLKINTSYTIKTSNNETRGKNRKFRIHQRIS